MRFHLLYPNGSFSDLADYLERPEDRPGAEWVEGEPAEGSQAHTELSLLDELKTLFAALDEDTQADLGPLAAAVFMYLDQNNPVVAKKVIERAQIPSELEPLRASMLGKFGEL